jgi:hypothetical protein
VPGLGSDISRSSITSISSDGPVICSIELKKF